MILRWLKPDCGTYRNYQFEPLNGFSYEDSLLLRMTLSVLNISSSKLGSIAADSKSCSESVVDRYNCGTCRECQFGPIYGFPLKITSLSSFKSFKS